MADDAGKMNQDEVEALLSQSETDTAPISDTPAAAPSKATELSPAPSGATEIASGDVDAILEQAEAALASVDHPASELPTGAKSFEFSDLSGSPLSRDHASLDLVRDVELDLKIELGRTRMQLEDVLRLGRGAVVQLDKLAGDPVDIYVNGRLVARGEVLVLNDNFCVRVAELIAGETPA